MLARRSEEERKFYMKSAGLGHVQLTVAREKKIDEEQIGSRKWIMNFKLHDIALHIHT